MSRIGAGISGLEQFFLSHLQQLDQTSLQSAVRLATGKQVPKPSFDPTAFIQISEMESRLHVLQGSKQQIDVAANIGAQSQLVVDQVRSQLTTIRQALLADEDRGLSSEQRSAQQAKIDAAIAEIDNLAGREINGRQYLNGSANYSFSGQDHSQIRDVQVYALRETTFSGEVTSAARQSVERYQGSAGEVDEDATFTLTGKRGSAVITVQEDESLTDAAARINEVSHATGITARRLGSNIIFTTVDFGEEATIDIDVTSGAFDTNTLADGKDAAVTVNGQVISNAQVDGNRVSYINNGTHVTFEFEAGFTGQFNPVTVSEDRAATFRLLPDMDQVTKLALPGIQAAQLGGISGRLSDLASGGSLSGLDEKTSQAIRVVDEALAQLTLVEGRVDAFADVTVASAGNLVNGFTNEISDALEDLNAVNQDEESLILAKNQALAANTVAALAISQQQQLNVLGLVKLLAGI